MTRWFNAPLRLHRRWKNASKSQKKRQIAGKYKLLHEIGQGASGIVHLAVEIKTNKRYVNIKNQYQFLINIILTHKTTHRLSRNSTNLD
jgi:hypothetical protein